MWSAIASRKTAANELGPYREERGASEGARQRGGRLRPAPLTSMSDFENGRSLLAAFARLELHATRKRAVYDKVRS